MLSDLYAMGVVDCDNVLMILAESTDMSKEERHTVTSLMIKGFHGKIVFLFLWAEVAQQIWCKKQAAESQVDRL